MKITVLVVVALCYFHSRCSVNAQGGMDTSSVESSLMMMSITATPEPTGLPGDSEDPTNTSNTTDSEDPTITGIDNITTISNETDSNIGGQAGLSTGAIVGIVVGVVALVVLVTLLVIIVIVLSLKVKSKKAKVVSPMSKSTDSKMISHGKSQAMKEVLIVDSS